MELFWMVAICPIAVTAAFYLLGEGKTSVTEVAVSAALSLLAGLAIYQAGRYSKMGDVEVWSGEVTRKERVRVSCSHSYRCRCRQVCSGSGGSRSCSTYCDTCYEHFYDVDWDVFTTSGSNFTIDRTDRQGLREPPRWTAVAVGEPASTEHSYTNYVRAAPDSLFNAGEDPGTYEDMPAYPGVYDYYRISRAIAVGVRVDDLAEWSAAISEMLKKRGGRKQVNAVIVLTSHPPAFAEALRRAWFGGKKNDAILVVGTDGKAVAWARVISWSKDAMFDVQLRDDVLGSGPLSGARVVGAMAKNIDAHWARRPMEEFEYLKSEIEPPTWALVLAFLISTGAAVGLGMKFREIDLDAEVVSLFKGE